MGGSEDDVVAEVVRGGGEEVAVEEIVADESRDGCEVEMGGIIIRLVEVLVEAIVIIES